MKTYTVELICWVGPQPNYRTRKVEAESEAGAMMDAIAAEFQERPHLDRIQPTKVEEAGDD